MTASTGWAIALGLLWASSAAAAPGAPAPTTMRGEVVSFGKTWVEIAQPSGAVFRLPKSKLEDPGADLRPGKSAIFQLSDEEVRKLKVVRTVKANRGYQPPSEWPKSKPDKAGAPTQPPADR